MLLYNRVLRQRQIWYNFCHQKIRRIYYLIFQGVCVRLRPTSCASYICFSSFSITHSSDDITFRSRLFTYDSAQLPNYPPNFFQLFTCIRGRVWRDGLSDYKLKCTYAIFLYNVTYKNSLFIFQSQFLTLHERVNILRIKNDIWKAN